MGCSRETCSCSWETSSGGLALIKVDEIGLFEALAGHALSGDFARDMAVVTAYAQVPVAAATLAFRQRARREAA